MLHLVSDFNSLPLKKDFQSTPRSLESMLPYKNSLNLSLPSRSLEISLPYHLKSISFGSFPVILCSFKTYSLLYFFPKLTSPSDSTLDPLYSSIPAIWSLPQLWIRSLFPLLIFLKQNPETISSIFHSSNQLLTAFFLLVL